MNINVKWHEKNIMPKNPSLDQRIEWHINHSKNCKCRKMPEKIKEEIEKRLLNTTN